MGAAAVWTTPDTGMGDVFPIWVIPETARIGLTTETLRLPVSTTETFTTITPDTGMGAVLIILTGTSPVSDTTGAPVIATALTLMVAPEMVTPPATATFRFPWESSWRGDQTPVMSLTLPVWTMDVPQPYDMPIE
jgi:hypothetical protein